MPNSYWTIELKTKPDFYNHFLKGTAHDGFFGNIKWFVPCQYREAWTHIFTLGVQGEETPVMIWNKKTANFISFFMIHDKNKRMNAV